VIARTERAHLAPLSLLGALGNVFGRAPIILPPSSMRARSPASPHPRSTAQQAPPVSIASISVTSRVIAPLLPTPAGIWR
jgi:hypothetical protein